MSKSVCLINPPHPYLKQPQAQAPLGLMYIAAYLREHGISVQITDLSAGIIDPNIEIPDADIYGITGTVVDRQACNLVANYLSQERSCDIVLGGPITQCPTLLDDSLYNYIVVGEGEHAMLSIVEGIFTQGVITAQRITDLDSLPFPARDLIENRGTNVFAYNKQYKKGGSTVIITSRGCAYNCAFCAAPGIWNKHVIHRSAENVLAEIDQVITDFGIKQFRFSDDSFTVKQDRLFELCLGLQHANIVWRCSIRTKPNSLRMFRQMKIAGCVEVSFGVESGDPHVLSVLNKRLTVEDNHKAIMNAKEAGLVVRILMMINTPGETLDTVPRNIEFLEIVKDYYDTIALTRYVPIPGSAIARQPCNFHCTVLDEDIDNYNFYMWGPDGMNNWAKHIISLEGMTDKQLRESRWKMRQYVLGSGKSNKG